MRFTRPNWILAAFALAACSSVTGAGSERVVGLISIYNDRETPDVLVVPSAVSAGAAFTAEVATFGSSSCTRAAGAEVTIQGMLAEIVPFDVQATGAQTVCTSDLRRFPRPVQLHFATVGNAVVRVRGVDLRGAPVTLERTVVVR